MSKKTGTRRSAKKSTTATPILDPTDGNLPSVSTQEPSGDTVNTTAKPRPRPRIIQNPGSAGTIVLPGTSSKKTPLLASPDSANENADTLSTQETSADTGPPPALSSVSTRGPARPSTANPRPKPKNSTSAQQTSADTGPLPALSSVSTRGPAQPSTANPKPKPKNSTSAQQTSASTASRQTGNNTNTAALQAQLAALHGKLLLQCNVMPLIF